MFSRKYTVGACRRDQTLTLQMSSATPFISPVGTVSSDRNGFMPYFFSLKVPYFGINMVTSWPSFASARGKKYITWESPPTVANGATSAATKKILSGVCFAVINQDRNGEFYRRSTYCNSLAIQSKINTTHPGKPLVCIKIPVSGPITKIVHILYTMKIVTYDCIFYCFNYW